MVGGPPLTGDCQPAPSPAHRSIRFWGIALVVLTVLTRLPVLLHPAAFDDERVYSVVANVMNDGGLPYEHAIERKPPLLFWTYAAIVRAAGPYNWPALHMVSILWVLATMWGLYVAARRLFDERAGLVAAAGYAVFQSWGTASNLAFNGEVLMNLPVVWAYAIALAPATRSRWRPALFVAGALFGAGFLLKQPAAIAAVPAGLYLLSSSYRGAYGFTWRDSIGQAAMLTAGFAAALGAAVLVLWRQGILAAAFYWTITDHTVPAVFWRRGIEHTLAFAALAAPLVAPLLARGLMREAWASRRAEYVALAAWVVVSAVGAAAGGRFYPHYYIQLVPPLALLVAPFYIYLAAAEGRRSAWWRVAAIWTLSVAVVFVPVHVRGLAARLQPSEAGRWVREHSSESARLFVWGQGTRIYLDARRRPASRYIATFPLTGYIFGPRPDDPGAVDPADTSDRVLPGAWANLAADFRAHPPAFIIDTEIGERAEYPIARFPYMAALLTGYRQVAALSDGVVYARCPDVSGGLPPCG